MSTAEVTNHAIKYSQSFRKDREDGKASSRWSTDFDSMALKTVIKMLLSKWGILSIDMQRAIADDQQVFDDDGNARYSDNRPDDAVDPFEQPQANDNVIDAQAREVPQIQELSKQPNPVAQARQARKTPQPVPKPEPQRTAQDEYMQFDENFDESEMPFR